MSTSNNMYVIRHNDGKFLSRTGDTGFGYTTDLFKAARFSFVKATSIIEHVIAFADRKNWSVVEENEAMYITVSAAAENIDVSAEDEEVYLIKHSSGKFIYRDGGTNFKYTRSTDKASRFTYQKAINIIENSITPRERKQWEVVKEEAPAPVVVNECSDEFYSFDWEKIVDSHSSLYDELIKYGNSLRDKLSTVDLEICDIRHCIELFDLDATKEYKVYKMLKERLMRRRYIKDEMARVNCFLSGTAKDFSSGDIKRQMENIDRQRYSPRVLKELFE